METFRRKIEAIHQALGIDSAYQERCGLQLQPECENLVEAGRDVYGRFRQMEANALVAWREMQAAAMKAGIVLELISAYRSAEYQQAIFQRKLDAGLNLDAILAVNAAPGFSEHHSGRAIDIGTPDCEPLSEDFENSQAFIWLTENAAQFGFRLSFPRDNPFGVLYEPWHWFHTLPETKNS